MADRHAASEQPEHWCRTTRKQEHATRIVGLLPEVHNSFLYRQDARGFARWGRHVQHLLHKWIAGGQVIANEDLVTAAQCGQPGGHDLTVYQAIVYPGEHYFYR